MAVSGLGCGMRNLSCDVLTSLVAAHGLSECSERAELPLGMWDLSSPSSDQTCVSYIHGEFLITESPGKSQRKTGGNSRLPSLDLF